MKNSLRIALLFLVVGLDQLGKLYYSQRDLVVLNHGGVFGLFPSRWWVVVLGLIWLIILKEWWLSKGFWNQVGMGLIVAGGFSNLVDRVLVGAVRDFIYYPWFGFYGNMADIGLGVGAALLLVKAMKRERTG